MKILIAGGGIGGLTAALCCLYHGHEVIVFETATEFREIGAGIQISPNAMKVFKVLGLADKISEKACQPATIEARMGENGRYIFSIPLAMHTLNSWGAPYLHIHRADYIHALQSAVQESAVGDIQLGAKVRAYTQSADGVVVYLSDGRTCTGDILIGADGIHSVVREQMLGADKAVFTGNVAWRAVVPIKALGDNVPDLTACIWMGAGRHCVTYRLRCGTLANFVGVVEDSDWHTESWSAIGCREDALADFAGWHPVITGLINATQPEALFRWALFERSEPAFWTDGCVALLGDAAHPMLPFLAQGAAMAVEDAWVLAVEVSKSGRALPESLDAYQARRITRVRQVQLRSRANMNIFHKRTWLGQWMTYAPMRVAAAHITPNLVRRRMDWLYGYDVLSE